MQKFHINLFAFCLMLCFVFNQKTKAQAVSTNNSTHSIADLVAQVDSFSTRFVPEKIFVHTDKPSYILGDTLWLKTYLLDGNTLTYSNKSSLVYLELFSDSSKLAKRISIPTYKGMGFAQIELADETFDEGYYTLRAYTNWMQNFGEASFFTQRIYIANSKGKHWAVSQQNELKANSANPSLNYGLKFQIANNEAFGFKVLNWRILNGKKVVDKGQFETLNNDMKGSIPLTDQNGPFMMSVKDKNSSIPKTLNFPLIYTDTTAADVQFMPESGYLVANLPGNIGVKAINHHGKGIGINGVIKNKNNEEVGTFQTNDKGIGIFNLLPEVGEHYTAEVKSLGLKPLLVKLPEIKPEGSVLQVFNNPSTDSIRVYLLFSKALINQKPYKIIGIQGGEVKFSAAINSSRPMYSLYIPKQVFKTGVVHLTLFNDINEPLNERLLFINRHDFLNVSLNPEKIKYGVKDSVVYDLESKTIDGKPIRGFFSVAVTDNSQVTIAPNASNIFSEVFLESEVTGQIENAGYYFSGKKEAEAELDMLLLTQGWVGYKWNDILKKETKTTFKAEQPFSVSGKVLNLSNKPMPNAKVLIMGSGKHKFILDTVTNAQGVFQFNKLPTLDSVTYFVQARNAKNKKWNVQLIMDEFVPAKFNKPAYPVEIPWYVNVDSVSRKLANNSDKDYQDMLRFGRVIKDVVIKVKRVRNTRNLNGSGQADQVFTDADFLESSKMGLEEILLSRVKGLSIRLRPNDKYFYLNEKRVRFVIDGVELDRMFMASEPATPMEYYYYLNSIFSNIKGEDLLGIEVMYNTRYTSQYNFMYPDSNGVMSTVQYAFIEITTSSGNGVSLRNNFGVALLRPIPITWPKDRYHPKYATTTNKMADRRNAVAWLPNVQTDNSGKGKFTFYSAGEPTTYTIILQGTDLLGNFGYQIMPLKIE